MNAFHWKIFAGAFSFLLLSANCDAKSSFLDFNLGVARCTVVDRNTDRDVWNNTNKGYSMSLSYIHAANSWLSLSAGLEYERRRFSIAYDEPFTRYFWYIVTVQCRHDYISMPLRVRLSVGNRVFGFVTGGVDLSYLVNSKQAFYRGTVDDNGLVAEHEENPDDRFDITLQGEAGVGIRINGSLATYISAFAARGITSFNEQKAKGAYIPYNNYDLRYVLSGLSVGMQYNIHQPAGRKAREHTGK
jgi:hypothetical protein